MQFGQPTRAKNWAFAALSILLSGFMLYSWATFRGIPPRAELQSASGQVSWVKSGRYGIRFGLDGVPTTFDYSSKGNAMGLVREALLRKDHPVVTVLYDSSKTDYHPVFELALSGKPIRSHEEIADAWQADENVALWLGVAFALGGLFLAWSASRAPGAT
jgi:hypothetical protein